MFLSLFCAVILISCGNDEKEERKITDYKEYVLTVASSKVPGVITSCGNSNLTDVYAVMKEQSTEWEAFGIIKGFKHESGYEYRIRISETSYLDYSKGEPAWTEYILLEVISKEKKSSANLPLNFIPDWYYEQYCSHIDSEFRYAVNAEQPEIIENDIKANAALVEGLHCYITAGWENWFLLDTNKKAVEQGILKKVNKDYTGFSETYKLLPPKGNVLGVYAMGLY